MGGGVECVFPSSTGLYHSPSQLSGRAPFLHFFTSLSLSLAAFWGGQRFWFYYLSRLRRCSFFEIHYIRLGIPEENAKGELPPNTGDGGGTLQGVDPVAKQGGSIDVQQETSLKAGENS